MEKWNGTMLISPVSRKPFKLTGLWEYSYIWKCWYLEGMSFPAEICKKVSCDGVSM